VGWAGSSTCGSNRAPRANPEGALEISLASRSAKAHTDRSTLAAPEERTRQIALACSRDGPHPPASRRQPPLELPGSPVRGAPSTPSSPPGEPGHPPSPSPLGRETLVRRGPDLCLQVVAEEPELPFTEPNARPLRAQRPRRDRTGWCRSAAAASEARSRYSAPGRSAREPCDARILPNASAAFRDPFPSTPHFFGIPRSPGRGDRRSSTPSRPERSPGSGVNSITRRVPPGHRSAFSAGDRLGAVCKRQSFGSRRSSGKGVTVLDADGGRGPPRTRGIHSFETRVFVVRRSQPRRVDETGSPSYGSEAPGAPRHDATRFSFEGSPAPV